MDCMIFNEAGQISHIHSQLCWNTNKTKCSYMKFKLQKQKGVRR